MKKTWCYSAFACCIGMLASVAILRESMGAEDTAVTPPATDAQQPVKLDKSYGEGKGLQALPAWEEVYVGDKPAPLQRSKTWFAGETLKTFVYESGDGTVQFAKKSLQQDYWAFVLQGTTVLTSPDGARHVYRTGDTFVAPKGWGGTWEFKDEFRAVFVLPAKTRKE